MLPQSQRPSSPRLRATLDRQVGKDKIAADERDVTLARVTATDHLGRGGPGTPTGSLESDDGGNMSETAAPYGTGPTPAAAPARRVRTHHLREMKERGERWAMLGPAWRSVR